MCVRSFDPDDQNFTNSDACLFQPLTQEELEEYKIDKKSLTEDEDRYLQRFQDTYNELPRTYSVLEHCQTWHRARQILFCLEIFESSYTKEMDEDTVSIEDVSYWDNIK